MGDACFPHYLGRRLLPDVLGCPVSWIVSEDVCSKGYVLRLPRLARQLFTKRLGFSDTEEVKCRNAHLSH